MSGTVMPVADSLNCWMCTCVCITDMYIPQINTSAGQDIAHIQEGCRCVWVGDDGGV